MSDGLAGYPPFPPFTGWAAGFDPSVVDGSAERLRHDRSAATPESL